MIALYVRISPLHTWEGDLTPEDQHCKASLLIHRFQLSENLPLFKGKTGVIKQKESGRYVRYAHIINTDVLVILTRNASYE